MWINLDTIYTIYWCILDRDSSDTTNGVLVCIEIIAGYIKILEIVFNIENEL